MTAGAGAGAALWVGEIYLLGISHGLPLRSESLFAWSVGAAVGGLATLPASALLSRTPIFASRWLSAVPIGLATLMVLAFAHQQYLPGSMEPASLAATAAIAAIAVGVWWIVGEPVGRALGGQVGATLLFVSLFIALVAVDRRGAGKISLWVPKAPETIAAAPYTRPGTRQLIVMGVDGGSWRDLEHLIDSGRMPNLESLLQRGQHGVLNSSIDAMSPVAWTTLLTGKPPEEHGITGWEFSTSINRRVDTVWGELDQRGWSVIVANVPGSFPADRLHNGKMFAGFPLPTGSRSNRGWLLTADRDTDPLGPRAVAFMPDESWQQVKLEDLPAGFALEPTLTHLLIRMLPRALVHHILLAISAQTYVELEFQHSSDGRLRVRPAGQESPLIELTANSWSDWLIASRGDERLLFKLRRIDESPQVSVFVTALFHESSQGSSQPADLIGTAASEGFPYIAEGTGWQIFYEPRSLHALREHQADLEEGRALAVERLMKGTAWDAVFYVFTATDRIQHAFRKFLEPDDYAKIYSDSSMAHQLPSSDLTRQHRDAIDRSYLQFDAVLGRLAKLADEDTLILIISDHGSQSGPNGVSPTAGIHHADGMYLIAGPGIMAARAGVMAPSINQVDIVPLMLSHLGIVTTRSWPPQLSPAPSVQARAVAGDRRNNEAQRSDGSREKVGDAILEQLRSLGYVE
jgi:hypothetical protein